MRVLVTGGAGYIGSHIVLELMELGHNILVVDDMANGNEANLFPGNEFINGHIQDPNVLKEIFSRPVDAVFHFAAWKAAGESMTNPSKYTLNNLNGTFQLISAMLENDCKYIVFSSSAAVYGTPQYLPLDEKHPLSPENYYGYTKLCIEENLRWFDQLKGLKSASLRYFNAAGYDTKGRVRGIEKAPANLLPIIMEVASGLRKGFEIYGDDYDTPDGTCVRDYIHVSDLATAHVLALKQIMETNQSLTVNLGSESGYSVKEMADLAEKVVGKPIAHKIVGRRAGDPAKLLASSAKARSLLGWKPIYSDADTLLSSMWELYRNL
ncbi:UDP-glucose 4-epimerase GalE [Leptospira ilyithenensis]|uniref:UDP-glucose 4-epimerase n=1 Tax=Leptospira ilyithenensis TaxID=2484901 RepID=A0A4V6QMS6_9LEPT|nr:UDP-glucose 4-epimerase GalE [Leptospira ilyithenensis]TGN09724.1 UDP-glucose 4-epimerase GalE [Leptospira ilyithenensis]